MARLSGVDEQRARLARRASRVAASGVSGFTLVELLVTIVVLAVLSGVVVVAVGGLQGKSQASACLSDRTALEGAMERYRAIYGEYVDEAHLVAAGQLRSESSMHDVELGEADFSLTPVGVCADTETLAAASPREADLATQMTTPTTTPAPSSTTVTTIPLKKLTLASVCTEPAHWPDERAWRIKNPNAVAVPFTLDAVNAADHENGHVTGVADHGDTTWHLPAADRAKNTALLDAAGRQQSKHSNNRRC